MNLKKVILNCIISIYNRNFSCVLFGILSSSNLAASIYRLIVILDVSNSISSTSLTINRDDLVVLLVNSTMFLRYWYNDRSIWTYSSRIWF